MNPSRILLIVNPAANHGRGLKLLPVIERLLHDQTYKVELTTKVGHAKTIAAKASDYDIVVAVGGDGTVHEVLNGLMQIDTAARPALGILPIGSGNDTCRTLGIPRGLSSAIMVLRSGVRRKYDLGRCNDIYFNNSFSIGLDAEVTAKAVEFKATTPLSGLPLYLLSLVYVLFKQLRRYRFALSVDTEESRDVEVLLMAATNGPTYGGGFAITPNSTPDDGLFDTCTIAPLSLPQTLLRLPFVVVGKHTGMSPVTMSRHQAISIESPTPLPAQIDGEVFLENSYVIKMLPLAIEYVVPRVGDE